MNWHDSKCSLSFILNFCVKWWIKWRLDRNKGKHLRHNYQAANILSAAQHDSFLLPCSIPFGYNPNLSRHSRMDEIIDSLMLPVFSPHLFVWYSTCFHSALLVRYPEPEMQSVQVPFRSDPWKSFSFLFFPTFKCVHCQIYLCVYLVSLLFAILSVLNFFFNFLGLHHT